MKHLSASSFRVRGPLLFLVVNGFLGAALILLVLAFSELGLSNRLWLFAAAILFMVGAAGIIRARVVLTASEIVVRGLFRTTTVQLQEIVRSIVIFDPSEPAIQGLHVQRVNGPAVTINVQYWSRADIRRLLAVPALRVQHHDGSEEFV